MRMLCLIILLSALCSCASYKKHGRIEAGDVLEAAFDIADDWMDERADSKRMKSASAYSERATQRFFDGDYGGYMKDTFRSLELEEKEKEKRARGR